MTIKPGIGMLAVLLALCACATPEVPEEFLAEVEQSAEYRIMPADILEIRVWKNPELSVQAPVLPDGALSVPLVGEVEAEGLTSGELEELIATELAEFIANPDVTVVVLNVDSQRVYVVGEVQRPGPQALGVTMRLMDSLSTAGGFTPYADRRRIRVIRQLEGGEIAMTFNFNAYVKGNAPGSNVELQAGDVVVVPD